MGDNLDKHGTEDQPQLKVGEWDKLVDMVDEGAVRVKTSHIETTSTTETSTIKGPLTVEGTLDAAGVTVDDVNLQDDESIDFGTDEDFSLVYDSTDDRGELRTSKDIRVEDNAGTELVTIANAGKVTIANGALDMSGSNNIQDAGTDAITFDGSQNVDVPNGTLSQGGSAVVLETRTLSGGTGINSLGDLSANRTVSIDTSAALTWANPHTFTGGVVVTSTDTDPTTSGGEAQLYVSDGTVGVTGDANDVNITADDGSTQKIITLFDYSAGGVPNSALVNSDVTVSAGDGLNTDGNGTLALGDSETFSVAVADIAGTGLESDGGSPADLRIATSAAGNGLTGGSGSALAIDTDGVGTDELDLSIAPEWTGTHVWNTGAGANLQVDETGPHYNTANAETLNLRNVGSGSLTLQEDGTTVVKETRTLTGGDGIATIGDLSSDRTITVAAGDFAGSGLTTEGSPVDLAVGSGTGITVNTADVAVDQSFTPTWTGAHDFDGGVNTADGDLTIQNVSQSANPGTAQNGHIRLWEDSDGPSGHIVAQVGGTSYRFDAAAGHWYRDHPAYATAVGNDNAHGPDETRCYGTGTAFDVGDTMVQTVNRTRSTEGEHGMYDEIHTVPLSFEAAMRKEGYEDRIQALENALLEAGIPIPDVSA